MPLDSVWSGLVSPAGTGGKVGRAVSNKWVGVPDPSQRPGVCVAEFH